MALLKLVNGLPTTVQPYDQSIYYSGGLSSGTNITLPSSGSFTNASAADLLVMVNDRVAEFSSDGIVRDFQVVGSGPTYTQIKFIYDLPNDSVVHFKQNIG